MNNSHQMKMAKNIANLRAKSSKKQQAHLLCQSLIQALKRGKE
jgi:hypothetical protein